MTQTNQLFTPRPAKPREHGISVLIDNGLPTNHFIDAVQSHAECIDFIKFGWGTGLVTKDIALKIDACRNNHIEYFFGGTLFERYIYKSTLNDYIAFCKSMKATYVEVSNGTVDISNTEKAEYVHQLSRHFKVFSEVGFKDSEKSIHLHPAKWIEYIKQDLDAGAQKVITESRESGTSGICRDNGELRYGLIHEILENIPEEKLIFEAPNKALQTYFIQQIGPNVNLANINFQDIIPLETLRLGLRSDTFFNT